MTYTCELKELPARPTLSVRTILAAQDLPPFLGKTYGGIVAYLMSLGKEPVGMPFVAYYNMDMQSLDIEAGFPLVEAVPGKGELKSGEFPAGKYASTLYTGPYSDCAPAYDELAQWIAQQGYTPTGVAYEMYFDGPETPPEKTRTEILFQLA
jgi:effector-binding domain-containing protein